MMMMMVVVVVVVVPMRVVVVPMRVVIAQAWCMDAGEVGLFTDPCVALVVADPGDNIEDSSDCDDSGDSLGVSERKQKKSEKSSPKHK